MHKARFLAAVSAAALFLSGAQAQAATQIINGSGKLTGATGVTVGSSTYNVEFVEGTCSGLFNGCSAFTFQNATDAGTAAQALLDQVFTGSFNSDYTLTYGCGTNATFTGCLALIPFAAADSQFSAGAAFNTNAADSSSSIINGDVDFFDTTFNDAFVWARFTPATGAVPEASTWAMMLIGLGAIGAVLRRRKTPALT